MTTDERLRVLRRALISVSDKSGLVELGQALAARGVEILSTGGSARALREAGLAVLDVAAHTGFPEILDGRVKTLHPAIHGGILADRDKAEHRAALEDHGIAPIDLVVVNLYPFEATVAAGAPFEAGIENIDIGGPALIRAAAKNWGSVAVIVDPADYGALKAELEAHSGATSAPFRLRLAAKAFARTAAYDGAIGAWFAGELGDPFPEQLVLGGRRAARLRYGENPHQAAAFYAGGGPRQGAASAKQVQGKELSYNNLNDTDAAFELVAEFAEPAIAIIKHANPCGVAQGTSLAEAYRRAHRCDPLSAFGGVIAANRPLDGETAEEIVKLFTEVIIAPGADEKARRLIAEKKSLRLLLTEGLPDPHERAMIVRHLAGGYLVQERDATLVDPKLLRVVTKREPSANEMRDLLFAFTVAKHVKSNAIVYAKALATVGIGAGQMSRVDAARIAAFKAEEMAKAAGERASRAKDSVVASDAFFPFADGLIAAAEAGATAVIQPGGSVRDEEVIAAADERGLAMVFTGVRHFRH
ncbi:MAG TPA: bifunctional phosphoribosylaminoimidazolecarboxamide formyltransferase/IMP cyclohydrolase [Alphaproteobacteria bacterium]|nr:bifunctional phosphoribosylaminoimidazolecarboxamide formyltransferase/IMP cyclohydrolase [Alphaproteobacteria bacterium]